MAADVLAFNIARSSMATISLCRINNYLSSTRKDFKYLCHPTVEQKQSEMATYACQTPVINWVITHIFDKSCNPGLTSTTRTPTFWRLPLATSWLPILLSYIGSQVKRRQSQSYKLKEFVKISNFWILKQALHATYLLNFLDEMCKYEMDPTSIVEDTERTRFCPQTDRRTNRRTRWNQYTPLSTSLKQGV